MTKWVYSFGNGLNEGRAEMRNLLGGKGANLAEMASIGLPVPPGFTITTEVCSAFYDNGRKYPDDLHAQVGAAMQRIEEAMGLRFGDADAPLLVSVRSGARVSMPGMMDTVLNLGLNDTTVEGLARSSGDERFAWDSYRRFVQMYGSVVMGVAHHHFEDVLDQFKRTLGVVDDTAISATQWREVVKAYHEIISEHTGQEFPSDPQAQLWGAIGAVFGSWMNPRANTYRKLHDIPASWGTAVNVQSMVFGNMGDDCATGVCFTRDPSTGEDVFYGEYLVNAQGEDVVAGIRTPQPMSRARAEEGQNPMETVLPDAYAELLRVRSLLEGHYHDMQDIEFTVQRNVLYLLQTRNGKRTAAAALKIAIDMAREGLISKEDAICRVPATSLDQLLHPALDPKAERVQLTRGLPASPGAASGAVVFTAEECEARAARGEDVILVRVETSPEDVHGMHAARGVLTARGGMTSHAAVVARGMGRVCVAGAGSVHIDYTTMVMTIDGHSIAEGEWITLDGSTGAVYLGRVATIPPILSDDFNTLMGWADATRRLGVRANAETPDDAKTARRFGAEGIGLARTEHMFFGPDRIGLVRQMIIADDEAVRQRAINALLTFQRDDFVSIFRIMAGLPVTVRLLDPPLHEFLPHAEGEIAEVATALGRTVEEIRARCASLAEANPMLGHRGCRLGLTNPEIYAMQVRALIEAALQVSDETGKGIVPEIMIPLVATKAELEVARRAAEAEIISVLQERGASLDYRIGTMIELPRAAIQAGEIAHHADFFSFGTNDLTQTTFGLSRDDAGSFLPFYVDHGLLPKDPFVSIDRDGVGALVRMGVERGRATHPGLKLGICGEHGGDPDSIAFFEAVGLDYVSCSPFRVPVARLAAAQAALAHRKENAAA
ncbi:pyruvate, phosphate dikinase [Novacetimonas hansenii]|uniref:Pyruvate, phosphate dikinase n=1 Tax=Novacetimonas hansenii TaxID=436 RepID=A0AAW5EWT8_NOVHA|nr:pyruvate, phosphate dikinase [Novacetimonas hansenii]MBL7236172.1 pyruvate, phosphate dikinase [Novacetimonas hansenii]MCJ8355256.1 pyruvate, phosphate dikinase [Novacetimonas hansenii]QOF94316.1 pyruvate, phosphate dikinase [Novacetimonas hansenii]RFO99556.1 pyruvate, phosphate dikinase [Novacetimonas hansenii]WEQ59674.1 pyruvate, phosphate dikinase [Novacetimonas hansenii]